MADYNGYRLAQLFEANTFAPTKASLFLRAVGISQSGAFTLGADVVSVDASNFSTLTQGENKLVFDGDDTEATGRGSIKTVRPAASTDWAVANYPIRTNDPRGYFFAIRYKGVGASVTIFIDGISIQTSPLASSTAYNWHVFARPVGIPDADEHIMGVRIEGNGASLDKLYFGLSSPVFSGVGPDLTTSPFATVHLQVYEVDDSLQPQSPLSVYAYKTTRAEIKRDDWYNFDLNPLYGSVSYAGAYALVVSASGGSNSNYVLWDALPNDEYSGLPSAVRV
ncbi:MAG: hypothetical protein HC888_01325 [Candidatus Competibacteraceae bacterium]|nr:hypothetical protein [Candidatus Competibacteraceae bacterium]